MPKVPAGSGQVIPFQAKPPEEVYLAMAAAQMDRDGRLFEPNPFGPENETAQAALAHAEKSGIKPDEPFEHGGDTWVHGNGAIDRASEQQIIDSSTKKLRAR